MCSTKKARGSCPCLPKCSAASIGIQQFIQPRAEIITLGTSNMQGWWAEDGGLWDFERILSISHRRVKYSEVIAPVVHGVSPMHEPC